MTLSPHQFALLLMACGAYFMVTALTAKSFISESDIPATDEERLKAKATPAKRLIFILAVLRFFCMDCTYG
jgi:hypothetical protein